MRGRVRRCLGATILLPVEASEEPQEALAPDPGFAPDWPEEVRLLCARLLKQYDADEIRGRSRLGDRAFDEAPERVEVVKQIVRDLSLEKWEPPLSNSEVQPQLQELMNVLDEMVGLSSSQDDFVQRSEALNNRLHEITIWFQSRPPRLHSRPKFAGWLVTTSVSMPTLRKSINSVRELRSSTRRSIRLRRELESSHEAVSQARAAAGTSASEEQAEVFKNRTEEYEDRATKWLVALILSVPLSAGLALITFLELGPESGSKDVHDFAGLGFGLFVLGLLAFAIRVCAQNFRVNRHLAAVARSKEASISTFQRMVASVEDAELRSAVALTLVQSIFAVEETGLIDGSGDHVTLVERAVLPNLPSGGSGS